jgi:hypothetical protein
MNQIDDFKRHGGSFRRERESSYPVEIREGGAQRELPDLVRGKVLLGEFNLARLSALHQKCDWLDV